MGLEIPILSPEWQCLKVYAEMYAYKNSSLCNKMLTTDSHLNIICHICKIKICPLKSVITLVFNSKTYVDQLVLFLKCLKPSIQI